mmetsp:Transcript_47150/g.135058  ORF Transcript_47150/g.135058 Transcript_47150/m.135058 type:complete len:324 (-) Transcript_47150:47-1018(-)
MPTVSNGRSLQAKGLTRAAFVFCLSNHFTTCALARMVTGPPAVVSVDFSELDTPVDVEDAQGAQILAGGSRRRRRTLTAQALHGLAALEEQAEHRVHDQQSGAFMARAGQDTSASADASRSDDESVRFGVDGNSSENHSRQLPMNDFMGGPTDPPQQDPSDGIQLELHLPGVTLKELHDSARKSVAEFLLALQAELSRGREGTEFTVIGLSQRYRLDTSGEQPVQRDTEVVVKIWAKLTPNDQRNEVEVIDALSGQLADPACTLRNSTFSFAMQNLSITTSNPLGSLPVAAMVATGTQALSAMALPIGISAAFTGFLLWLAAW